jgi:hypothetical protein
MANSSSDTDLKIRVLGIYQIAGGILGIGLTMWLCLRIDSISGPILFLLLIAFGLYCYSIYCGILLLKKKNYGLKHALINQFLQLLNFTIFGFSFKYISGAFLSIGLDLTTSVQMQFRLGISTWQITVNDNPELFEINLNLVALFLIIFIDRLKRKIAEEKSRVQVSEIGQ